MYSLTQLPLNGIISKDISRHISQLHVSARLYGTILRLSFA